MAKPKIKPRFTPPTTVQLLAQADAHQTAQRYKDLIEVYKELLRREACPEWEVALAQAYGQRARALAAKGMYREAVAMWESSHISEHSKSDTAMVVGWMLAVGMYSQATILLREIPVLPADIQIRLGVALLMGHDELASGLPDDAPLIRHLEWARSALKAWCQGNDVAAREQLRAIPFRSPYRELRQIIQGLLATDQESIETIPVTSPYAGFARAAFASRAPLVTLEKRLAALRPAEQELAAILRGVDPAQLRVILDLRAALVNTNENLVPLFRWVTTKPAPVAEEQARRFALAILPHQPQLLDIFLKRFGPLNPFENARLRALFAERDDDLERAQSYWKTAFNACDRKDATSILMGALILRHQAMIETKMNGPDDPEVIKYLNQSLKLDPLDQPTWLSIIKQMRGSSDAPKWYTLAEQALTHLPEDSELLLLAAQGAAERGAYKKAIGYVTTLLRLDPINISARRLLIGLHLSHARKSLKVQKIAIAARELDAAKNLSYGDADAVRIAINQALLALAQGQLQSAREFAVRAMSGPAGGIGIALLSQVEGQQAGFKQKDLIFLSEGLIEAAPSAVQIVALLELLEELQPLHADLVQSLIKTILQPSLRAAATHHSYTEDQLICLFEILRKGLHWDLMVAYATTALERWPGRPIFVFYYYTGVSHNQGSRLAKRDLSVLEEAREAAMQADDIHTVRLIDELMEIFPFRRLFPRRNPRSEKPLDPHDIPMPPEIQKMVNEINEMSEELDQPHDELIRNLLENFIENMDDSEPHGRRQRRRGRGKNK
ncbi:conserved hypothetical protein [Gammaproteobacteria bacterium]